MRNDKVPLTDPIVVALASLVDDSQAEVKREPSHSDLDFVIKRADLSEADPKKHGQIVGKAKRVRAILSWALEHNMRKGERLAKLLIDMVQGKGGFRPQSQNFVGKEQIDTLRGVLKSVGYELSEDGYLQPENEMTQALLAYAQRARKGVFDAALLVGTGKDLLEAVAKHVLMVKWSKTELKGNFRYTLGQAFIALDMETSEHKPSTNETPIKNYERALFELGCSVNVLRNKEGTGHGRPFLPTITQKEACNAAQAIGIVADYMLQKLVK